MRIDKVHRNVVGSRVRLRVGRGVGTGRGKTSGRGGKGQRARAGFWHNVGFEGGQIPLIRRVPKRGFVNSFAEKVAAIRLDVVFTTFCDGDVVDVESCRKKGLVRRAIKHIKIVGPRGDTARRLKFVGVVCSKQARIDVLAAGGEVGDA